MAESFGGEFCVRGVSESLMNEQEINNTSTLVRTSLCVSGFFLIIRVWDMMFVCMTLLLIV